MTKMKKQLRGGAMSRDGWKELAVIYVIPLNTAWRLRIWWPFGKAVER